MKIGFIGDGAWSKKNQEVAKSLGFEPIVRTYNYKDLLYDDDIRAVYICTPAPTLCNITLQCLNANKYVLAEKGVVQSQQDLNRVCLSSKLMVNYTYCYHPVIRAIRELSGGQILQYTSAKTSIETSHRDGISFINHGIHDIAKLVYLTGLVPESKGFLRGDTIFGPNFSVTNQYGDDSRKRYLLIYDKRNTYTFDSQTFKINGNTVEFADINPLENVWKTFQDMILYDRRPLTDVFFAVRVAKGIESAMEKINAVE